MVISKAEMSCALASPVFTRGRVRCLVGGALHVPSSFGELSCSVRGQVSDKTILTVHAMVWAHQHAL